MKRIKMLGVALAMLGVTTMVEAQSEIRKEVNVEVENGEHIVTITTTDKEGNITKEEYTGEEGKRKMKELHRNVPENAQIVRKMVEEIMDEEGNEIIIRKSHEGGKGEMMFRHHGEMTQEEREEFHKKMKAFRENLSDEEKAELHKCRMKMHRNMTEEEREAMLEKRMKVDVRVDEENGQVIIRNGDEEEIIDISEYMEGEGENKMIFISDERVENLDGEDVEVKKEIIIITRNVRIEDDKSLKNNLKGVEFSTFPNPNNGDFNIKMNLDGKKQTFFRIMDMNGKEIHKGEISVEKKGTYTQPIKMSGMPKGMYLIQVVQGKKAATKKVIIE